MPSDPRDPSAPLTLSPGSDVRAGPDGGVIARGPRGVRRLRSPASLLGAILERAAAGATGRAIEAALAPGEGEGAVRAALDELRAAAVVVERPGASGAAAGARTLGVAGEGRLAGAIAGRARARGWRVVRVAAPAAGASRWRSLLPAGARRDAGAGETASHEPIAACDAVAAALERGGVGDLLALHDACLEAGVTVVAATVDPDGVTVGPQVVGGLTACLGCVLDERLGHGASGVDAEALGSLSLGALSPGDEALAERAAQALIEGLEAFASPWLAGWQTLGRGGRAVARGASPRAGCARCERAAARGAAREADEVSAAVALGRATWQGGGAGPPPRVRRIGVIGGGSAGYLAALGLRARLPGVEVTLVESPSIPVIGVGEASTPDLVSYFHRDLGIDERTLYREVSPTWKLGIQFAWGPAGAPPFHYPFEAGWAPEAWSMEAPDTMSLATALMARGLGPVLRDRAGRVRSLLGETAYAYHLDNRRLVAFLQSLAPRRGVARRLATIGSVERAADGSVAALVTDDGQRLSFDLYVDCSGFRSRLLGQALGVPWQSYAGSLFNDRALLGDWPHGGQIAPYTRAASQRAGWCWTIPTPSENHSGYVFSSAHLTDEQAEAELRAQLPAMGEARLVRFRTGRHREAWAHNVVAIGNAYGFVEPLESTGLHLVIHAVGELARAVPLLGAGDDGQARRLLNERTGSHWDYLRDFLAVHFRFSGRDDTDYWRACAHDADLGGAAALVDLYRHGAPLSARPDRESIAATLAHDGLFNLFGWDVLLRGQGVPARWCPPPPRPAYDRWAGRALPALLRQALPHREALEAYGAMLEGRPLGRAGGLR